MKKSKVCILVGMFILQFFSICAVSINADKNNIYEKQDKINFVPGEILVKFKNDLEDFQIKSINSLKSSSVSPG